MRRLQPETDKLIQVAASHALEIIDEWHRWARIVPREPQRTLNLNLIRLVKGCVNLLRGWRDDVTKPETQPRWEVIKDE